MGRQQFMNKLFEDYKNIQGKPKDSFGKAFWDVLVITTADSAQQAAFELQISDKTERKELPIDLPIHVVTDPPGVRIGNGGSTLVALEYLDKVYGDRLLKLKVLLIHAGGWSQRMPSASVLGKIFSLLPHGHPAYQMLDLKLAMYWPFVARIEPGIFLVCADDFVVYDLGDNDDLKLPAQGFTVFAHPSPIEVGRTHGVFVIDDVASVDTTQKVILRKCLEVLQKPNDERMMSQGAVLNGSDHKFADGITLEGEVVYTDSCFYFGVDVVEKLLTFKKSVGDLGCEIDAYGDFLQALGSRGTDKYIHNTGNISQMVPHLLKIRQRVYDELHASDIHALILNASAFIHIGTTKELLFHFCRDQAFQAQMSFQKDIFNLWTSKASKCSLSENCIISNNGIASKKESTIAATACIGHSVLDSESIIKDDCFIEYCEFEQPISISSSCIISNCQLLSQEATVSNLSIPHGTFMHTIPVCVDNSTKFITVFFSILDNLKKTVPAKEIESLPFLGFDVVHFLTSQGMTIGDVMPETGKGADDEKEANVSLWNLKLFPAKATMTESLEDAVKAMLEKQKSKSQKLSGPFYSMADILKKKDVKAMLMFRKKLFNRISSC